MYHVVMSFGHLIHWESYSVSTLKYKKNTYQYAGWNTKIA